MCLSPPEGLRTRRSGVRRKEKRRKRGGKRRHRVQEDSTLDSWWHPDARDAIEEVLNLSERRFRAGKLHHISPYFSVV